MNDSEKEPKSAFLPTNLLMQFLLAVGAPLAVGLSGSLTGWWGALSKVILPNIAPQQLLDSIGLLLLLACVLSLVCLQQLLSYRKLKMAALQPIRKAGDSAPDPLKRRIPIEENLLIIAADTRRIGELTLMHDMQVHRVTSKHHFNEVRNAGFLSKRGGSPLYELSTLGNAYLVKHGIVPAAKPEQPRLVPQRVVQAAVIAPMSGSARTEPKK